VIKMSLTDFMKNKRLYEKFQKIFKMPQIKKEKYILVKPKTKNYMLIGTAFDYLLRFYIARHNNKIINRDWVCEEVKGLARFEDDLRETSEEIVNRAKDNYEMYLDEGVLSNNLLSSVILIAKLDGILRSGGVLPNSLDIEPRDIEDLNNLYSVIPKNYFMKNEFCVLNPTFGTASLMVGGADADLIIGDTLIDIKTTINFKFTKEYFLQLIGYFILNELGGIDNFENNVDIKKLGIYYSRYGYLFTFNVSDVVGERDLKEFKKLFIDVAQGFD